MYSLVVQGRARPGATVTETATVSAVVRLLSGGQAGGTTTHEMSATGVRRDLVTVGRARSLAVNGEAR